MTRSDAAERYVRDREKSPVLAFVLSLLLGPLGLLYANVLYGVILCVVAVLGFSTLIVPAFAWLLAAVDAPFAAISYNRKLESHAALIKEGSKGSI